MKRCEGSACTSRINWSHRAPPECDIQLWSALPEAVESLARYVSHGAPQLSSDAYRLPH